MLATVRLREKIGHQLEQRRRKGYANDNMSSHDCLINGIGLHGKTDSNDDSLLSVAKMWKPTWLQHHLDEHPVQPVWWQKHFAGVAIVHSMPTFIGLERPRKLALDEATSVAKLVMTGG